MLLELDRRQRSLKCLSAAALRAEQLQFSEFGRN